VNQRAWLLLAALPGFAQGAQYSRAQARVAAGRTRGGEVTNTIRA
jgi:hypothetical protein